jgi:hypothetical protein
MSDTFDAPANEFRESIDNAILAVKVGEAGVGFEASSGDDVLDSNSKSKCDIEVAEVSSLPSGQAGGELGGNLKRQSDHSKSCASR